MDIFRKIRNTLQSNPWAERIESAVREAIIDPEQAGFLQAPFHGSPAQERPADIARQVRETGYVLIPGVFRGATLTQLQAEFHDYIANCDDCGYQVDKHDGAVCIRVKPRSGIDLAKYPATAAFFDSALCADIACAFYDAEPGDIRFNSEIFVHETPQTRRPLSGALHWDRSQTLKFWIYLDDIPLQAGPMRIAAGSGKANRMERQGRRGQSIPLQGGVDNVVAGGEDDIVCLTGEAGTVLIHDTDASHGATAVEKGFTRRIMRGHTRKKK